MCVHVCVCTHVYRYVCTHTPLIAFCEGRFLMAISIENATPPKSTISRNSNSSVHIQIKSKRHFEFVPRDIENSEFLNIVDFGSVAFSVETVMYVSRGTYIDGHIYQIHIRWIYLPYTYPDAYHKSIYLGTHIDRYMYTYLNR